MSKPIDGKVIRPWLRALRPPYDSPDGWTAGNTALGGIEAFEMVQRRLITLGAGVATVTETLDLKMPPENVLILAALLRVGNGSGALDGSSTAWSNAASASKNITLDVTMNDGVADRHLIDACTLGTWSGNNYDYANARSIFGLKGTDRSSSWFFGGNADDKLIHSGTEAIAVFNREATSAFENKPIKVKATRLTTDGIATGTVEVSVVGLLLFARA